MLSAQSYRAPVDPPPGGTPCGPRRSLRPEGVQRRSWGVRRAAFGTAVRRSGHLGRTVFAEYIAVVVGCRSQVHGIVDDTAPV